VTLAIVDCTMQQLDTQLANCADEWILLGEGCACWGWSG